MTRKLIGIALLAAVISPALVTFGCASGNAPAPYSLTGASQDPIDQRHQEWLERQRFTDEKGHYHPELAEANRSLR